MFENKTILITGGAGFIGSNLAFYFQERFPKAKVVVFDKFQDGTRLDSGNLSSLGHFKNLVGFRGDVICGDINDPKDLELLDEYRFDYIFHQAAISDTTVQNQTIVLQTNLNAFKDLLRLAKRHGAKMIYASSGSVYGKLPGPHRVGVEEPINVYGFSKLAMDHLAMSQEDVTAVGLRYFNVYGPREYFKGKTASMILQFGLQILKGERPRLFEGSDRIKRDFIYVDDVIQANIKAAAAKRSGVYNVGTGKARSFQDIVDILCKELGIHPEYEYIPNPFVKQYQFFTQADIDSTREELGFEPQYSLEDGIRADIPYIKKIFEEEL
ncbi:MAG: ADP-glyceromanno-heptose 6-epimerase [Epsilonproteobacteria bacterium]|nr:ADP-glyceromanno-heptose 6-epimerase [Campylobacterota bacterium]NPA64103.1 ADP-glyceromanno-heptose 6-epimerase [Campylobacterota bacterium]